MSKIIIWEEVTHTFCDECGNDITRSNRYGEWDNEGNQVDLCTGPTSTFWNTYTSCRDKFISKRNRLAGDTDLA